MSQEQKEKFDKVRLEARNNVQKAVDVLTDTQNKLYELMGLSDTGQKLKIQEIIGDEESDGIEKKKRELLNLKDLVTSLYYTEWS